MSLEMIQGITAAYPSGGGERVDSTATPADLLRRRLEAFSHPAATAYL
ncbi:MAG: hypothetical protein L0H93_14345 [Nocardioides sp.]|nr:hypothetical protein [Nocardioides sp.]